MSTRSDVWPRDAFTRAVWDSKPTDDLRKLKPNERLVALAYADHANDQDFAWVTYPRMMERTGLSRDAVHRAMVGLRELGWLVEKEPAAQHRAARYFLRIPSQQSVSRNAEQQSGSQTADDLSSPSPGTLGQSSSPSPDTSSPSPDTSSPGDGTDQSSHHSPEGRSDDACAREDDARLGAIDDLASRFGIGLDLDTATAAVDAVIQRKNPDDPARYMAQFSLEDVQRWGTSKARPPARAKPTPKNHTLAAETPAPPARRKCPTGALIVREPDGTTSCCTSCDNTASTDQRNVS